MKTAQNKANAVPRSIIVKAEDAQPSLPEAFARWQSLGEFPADAVLCEFVGGFGQLTRVKVPVKNALGVAEKDVYRNEGIAEGRPETHRDTATGKLVDPSTWETLTDVWFKAGKKGGKPYQIFRPVSENAD